MQHRFLLKIILLQCYSKLKKHMETAKSIFNYKQSAFYYFKIQNLILVEPTYSIISVM